MNPQTDWAFAFWKNRPAIWSEVAAFSFDKGAWLAASPKDIGTEGRARKKATMEIEFGKLPEPPPFPVEKVATAFRDEMRRLQQI